LNRFRWLILFLGPLPIVGSSWTISAWFRSEHQSLPVRNSVLGQPATDAASTEEQHHGAGKQQSDSELADACAQSAVRWKSELGPECEVVASAPFVVAGDLSRVELLAWLHDTIEPAVRAMQRSYFRRPPTAPVSVLLFGSERSYNHYAQALFGEHGISIYGYYKPQHRTLILNIATGDGTLLHELTHALIDFDFPDAADWLNEGLASLHEQCRFRSSEQGAWIEGLPNWRLAGLQDVIRQGQLRSVASLLEDRSFRGPNEGTNYAQARYICLYLQSKGVLGAYYRDFRDHRTTDPRGLSTLASYFPRQTWQQLDQDFQRWALELKP